jgi:hypothetical protein
MTEVMKHPELQSFRRFMRATKDTHGLYAKFGVRNVEADGFMEIKDDIISKSVRSFLGSP